MQAYRVWTVVLLLPLVAGAEDYLGAPALLEKLSRLEAQPGAIDDRPGPALMADLRAAEIRHLTMTPEEAAASWLALFDRLAEIPAQDRWSTQDEETQMPLGFGLLFSALPPPPSWPLLRAALAERPVGGKPADQLRAALLRLLFAALAGDAEAVKAESTAVLSVAGTTREWQRDHVINQVEEVLRKWSLRAGDPAGIRTGFTRELARLERPGQQGYLQIPDLVTLLGEAEATPLLRRALLLPTAQLNFQPGENTLRLARQIAVEQVDQLRTPPWSLVSSMDSVALYEALDRRFPEGAAATPDEESGEVDFSHLEGLPPELLQQVMASSRGGSSDRPRTQARLYYLLGLIAAGRAEEARTLALATPAGARGEDIPEVALRQLEQAGYVAEVHAFLAGLLAQNPNIPFWEAYISLSIKTGNATGMVAMVRSHAGDPALAPAQRSTLQQQLVKALLAADQVDEGMSALFMLAKDDAQELHERFRTAVQGATLGYLLQRPEWTERGLVIARALMSEASKGSSARYLDHPSLANLLVKLGRGAEAEQLYLDRLAQGLKVQDTEMRSYGGSDLVSELTALVGVYHKVGRHADVLALVDKAPWWGVADLQEVMDGAFAYSMYSKSREVPLSLAVATALHQRGDSDRAATLLEAFLERSGGYDPAYELYVQLRGESALPFLERIYRWDPFEERPLIWKAQILRSQGRLEEAEQTARAAIAIDPSDGEEGKGDRMRVYAELAKILEARGQAEPAAFFQRVVQAIRQSEDADDFYDAGLLTRGIQMYRDSLALFADAYCIQSRMAVQLEQMGRYDEAAQHYQRAYELMPDSFGRVESHCFGCEGVFRSGRAQGVAERVFASLAEKSPERAQVHYLLGYLREEQGRYPEALTYFRRAVELDPQYLNAWSKIDGLGDSMALPAADRDAVVFKMLELDPLGRHGRPSGRAVLDLPRYWTVLAQAAQQGPAKRTSLYPLAASAERMKQEAEKKPEQGRSSFRVRRFYSNESLTTPAEALASHEIISPIVQLIDQALSQE